MHKTTLAHNRLIEENKKLSAEKKALADRNKALTMESAKISTLNKKLTAANEILVTTNKELIMRDPNLVKAIEEISKALKDKKSPDMSKLKRMVVGKRCASGYTMHSLVGIMGGNFVNASPLES